VTKYINIIGELLSLEWERLVYLKLKLSLSPLICGFYQGLFFAVLAPKLAIIYVVMDQVRLARRQGLGVNL